MTLHHNSDEAQTDASASKRSNEAAPTSGQAAPTIGEPVRVADYGDFDGSRIKHLELIQAVIARLGSNGFLVKGWALTTAGIFLGFSVQTRSWSLALVSLLPTLCFWSLDSYFLRCERLFRHLYDRVRVGEGDVAPFYMSATSEAFVGRAPRRVRQIRTVVSSPALSLFYGPIVVATIALLIAVAVDGPSQAVPAGNTGSPVAPAMSSPSLSSP